MKCLDLAFIEGYDWDNVFGEPGSYGDPLDFTRSDVAELYYHQDGENDGDFWVAIGRLKDGRYFRVDGWCDYTGWDCQSGNSGDTWETWDQMVFNLGDEDRHNLGIGNALGSLVDL